MLGDVASEVNSRNEPFVSLYSNDLIVEHLESKYGKDVIANLLVRFSFRHRRRVTLVFFFFFFVKRCGIW